MINLYAAAKSEALAPLPGGAGGRVLSVHDDYLNLAAPEGLVTFFRRGAAFVPFGVEVNTGESWLSLGISGKERYIGAVDRITVGDCLTIHGLDNCPGYSCRIEHPAGCIADGLERKLDLLRELCRKSDKAGGIRPHLGRFSPLSTAEILLGHKVERGCAALLAGVLAENEIFLLEGVQGLLGLGPGLTPSGDDFLLGFLVGLRHLCADRGGRAAAVVAQYLEREAPVMTGRLSAEYLRYAAVGYYHEYIVRLVQAVAGGTDDEIRRAAANLAALGHYSGTDLLLGFVHGGTAVLQTAREG